MVMNRLPKKAREELLWPRPKLNRAERATTLKHDPDAEFRDSIYRCRDDKAPTLVHLPNGAFKKAMANAALRIPGATKAEVGQLVQVIDPTVHLYGKPMLYMAPVREGGMTKTPNIRTRAMFVQWACEVNIQYIRKLVRETDIINLMSWAGRICGVGDGRVEKGTFAYGTWELVGPNDKRWLEIVKSSARSVQVKAMANPECVDADSEELYTWFKSEFKRREFDRHSTVQKLPPVATGRKATGRRRTATPVQQAHNGRRRRTPAQLAQ
jgi:hypothetical protein